MALGVEPRGGGSWVTAIDAASSLGMDRVSEDSKGDRVISSDRDIAVGIGLGNAGLISSASVTKLMSERAKGALIPSLFIAAVGRYPASQEARP